MKEKFRYPILAAFILISLFSSAQQFPNYAQFNLNNLAFNPAYGGSHLGLEFWAGRRNQWVGFPNAPISTYMSGTYTFRKNFNYKAVHSVGAYVEQDKAEPFVNKSAHLYYAIHLKISKALKMSFGIFAGYRSVGLSTKVSNSGDPALDFNATNSVVHLYPDFVPGYRLYSKRMFFDLSVRNLYKNKLKQGSKELGTDSKLVPQALMILGYRFHSPENDFVFTPAIKVQGAITRPPLTDLTFTTYYRKRVALGLTYRIGNSIGAMLQVRIRSNIIVGFAYEYPTNRIRYTNPNTVEVIMGFSPIMDTDGERPRTNNITACPSFDF